MQAVEKIFWADPYLTRLIATISSVEGEIITLDRTIFFAFSGGQESDRGTIASFPVLEARKEGQQIYYKLGPQHTLKPEDEVVIEIDWPRRYRLMRLHFAAEVVLELFYKKFQGIEKIGAHISDEKARIDFKWDENFSPHLPQIQNDANELIKSDIEIISAFHDPQTERRFWEVPGFSKVPCGGTHLKRTGEVGSVRLKRDNIGKGKQRLIVFVD